MAELNAAEATVIVAGTQVLFKRLQLVQKFNAHHTCEIEVDYDAFSKEKWMSNPTKYIGYIGKDINITFKMKQTGETNLFSGIVTNAGFTGRHGSENSIVITGASNTIKLDGKPTTDSFMDLPLKNIIDESVGNSGNGGAVTANPKFGSKLDYICQYNESCFEFLNRLSWEFGEWFFADGQSIYFGMKTGETATLEYDKEMTYFDLRANLVPQKFNRRHYLKHDDKNIDKDDPSDVPGVRGYLQVSKGRSESIYSSDVTTPLMADINSKKDLDDLVKAEKSRAVGEMLVMRGRTQTCKVKIGGSVTIQMPPKMEILSSVDTFLVTSVVHTIDQEGHYSNEFEGIIDGIEAIPMTEPKIPIAMPQIATVKDNADPKKWGRVKVQTDWQKSKNKTSNWIRVQTPDAGKSDKVGQNRGFVHIPEKDDIVMLGFEYGSPDRPFVAGSIYTSQTGKGGDVNNKIKSLTTRSGITVILDDDDNKGSVTVKDPSGNVTKFDGNGNTTMTVPNTFTVNATDIKLNASNSITVQSKPGKNGGTGKIDINAKENIQVNSETADIALTAQASNITLAADKGKFGVSSKETKMNSKGNTTQSSGGVFKITGSSNVEINK